MDPIDSLLVEKTLAGSLECFDVLMKRYERDVYLAVWVFGKSRENALDICQNVFLKAYRHLEKFGGRSSFKTWLMRIAWNEGLNWVRTQKRRDPPGAEETEMVSIPAGDNQEEALLEKERYRMIVHHLGKLNARGRLAVILRYFQEMSIREISEVMECSEDTVRNTLFRSVRRLRKAVASQ